MFIEILRAQMVPKHREARQVYDQRVHAGVERLQRDVERMSPTNPLSIFAAPDLTPDIKGSAERLHQSVPVGILGIELGERAIDVIDAGIGDNGGIAEPRDRGASGVQRAGS